MIPSKASKFSKCNVIIKLLTRSKHLSLLYFWSCYIGMSHWRHAMVVDTRGCFPRFANGLNIKIILGQSDAWLMRWLTQWPSILYWRLSDFYYYSGWSGSILWFRQNIINVINVGSKSWLPTCSSNITLSLPSYTGSALKRELNFCNSYLSLLYFWLDIFNATSKLLCQQCGVAYSC